MRKSLLKRLAIRLGSQKALHSYSAKVPKDGEMSSSSKTAKALMILGLLCGVYALMFSAAVSAVGMGGINVASALGQPLRAEIELVAISKSEKDSLVARLASPEAYKSAGLEYPYGNKFKFQIENRPDGQPYIKASSAQPVNDPFVSLLVELTWSSGKLSREYTFLLDPPGYVPEQPAQGKVEAVAPEVQTPAAAAVVPAVPEKAAAAPEGPAAPVTIVAPAEQPVPAQAAPAEAVTKPEEARPAEAAAKPEQTTPAEAAAKLEEQAAPKAAVVPANEEKLVVHRGDTLYKIAEQHKLPDMSMERMLVAMYRINADQFEGRNMNRIRTGKILRLPSEKDVMSVSLPDAVKEIHAQAADWNAYRQKLASAATVSKEPEAVQQVVTGKISSSIADMAPVAKESAKEVLRLSKGEAPGDQTGGAGGKSMSEQDKKNAAQEEAIAKSKALNEEKERTALLEKNLKDMQRLAQLKAEAASQAKAPSAAPAQPAVGEAVATSGVKPTRPAQPKPKQVKPEPEPSLLDQVLDEPLYLAGGVAALLALGGAGLMLSRRRKAPSDAANVSAPFEDVGDVTSRISAPVVPSPETGDFTATAVTEAAATPQSDNVDPISEADLFLNFGRDAQAEEILKEALQNTPNNHQIHLKLLGIYVNRKDASSFATIARQLKDSGDEEAWQQAVEMGRKLEPNNPMYGGFRSMEDTGSATIQMKPFKTTPEPESVPKPQASALDFDFDVSASAAKGAESAEQDSSGSSGMDFDVTSTNPAMAAVGGQTEAASPMSDDIVFDITGSHSFAQTAAQPEASKPSDSGAMAFTLDFPVESVAEKSAPAAQAASVGLEGISLNFDEAARPPSGPTAENKDDHWQEVATKLDLAKAYHEMGDASGAREILEEVMREGDEEQREAAQKLFEQLG